MKGTAPGVVGWREWVALPDLGVARLKAKVDTGARTSALHAVDPEEVDVDGRPHVRFLVQPVQRRSEPRIEVCAPLLERRIVRNSGGGEEFRFVIRTTVALGERRWPIELTLTRRDTMGFRMLLGREAVRRRFLVDPGRSYLAGRAAGVPR